jgi:two-component sensor histidine kinase
LFTRKLFLRFASAAILVLNGVAGFAQFPHLVLKDLLEKYPHARADTVKVRLLLQLDSFYLYKMPDEKHIFDSALLLGIEAKELSESLHFQAGYDDALYMIANTYAEMDDFASAQGVLNGTQGLERVKILIMLGERYIYNPDQLRQNLDSAYPFIRQALQVSESMRDTVSLHNSLRLLGKYYFIKGDFRAGKDCFTRVIEDYHRAGNAEQEAFWWSELGIYMPHADSTFEDARHSIQMSLSIYRKLGKKEEELDAVEDLSYLNLQHGNLGPAEEGYMEALDLARSLGSRRLFPYYSNIAEINRLKGNYNICLFYALAAVRNMDSLNDRNTAGVIYSRLADAYSALGETDEALEWYRRGLANLVDYTSEYRFNIFGQIVHGMLLQGHPAQALVFLQTFVHDYPPPRRVDKEMVAASAGDCYDALGQYGRAEASYLKMIALDDEALKYLNNESQGERGNKITGSKAYYTIGRFYVDRGKFARAKPFLIKSLGFRVFAPSHSLQNDIHWLLFKIDSAEKNYPGAIEHLEVCRLLSADLFNEAKIRQVEELKIQYDLDKKEKDLEVLRSAEQLQGQALQKAELARKYTYLLVFILLVLLAVLYSRYRLKQQNNIKMKEQQDEINAQYKSLQDLSVTQQRLLAEKEWLIKEMHHRVKNNFHMVAGLLGRQIGYLKTNEAIEAIGVSQRRVDSMALIHQKLYQSEGLSAVNMREYIHELVDYLRDSFNIAKTIQFQLQIEPIQLSLSYCLPIALILHEAATNSIKYAFPGSFSGIIRISLAMKLPNELLLVISDNGVGMPEGFTSNPQGSMGMNLMRGLCDDLEASFELVNFNGTEIRITFHYDPGTIVE